jgi:beta-lactamase regulating signal transducer with metallopeptidase domain
MTSFGNSAFLQALGWATLNSIWQMAALWVIFLLAKHFLRFSSDNKYAFAVGSICLGFIWFCYTFAVFYTKGSSEAVSIIDLTVVADSIYLPVVLSAASITYLLLLILPVYRLISNWQYMLRIKKYGLQKAQLCHRLFVEKTAMQLGIKKKVKVYISHLLSSPVTIGFLKPIILLPVAALSNLTANQVEAILLHELSHIKRRDYLINLVITFIHMILYFNPFVKLFMKSVEAERENCCDEMVLQFEYDKLSYASALLTLEKASASTQLLMICAADKKYLLQRIERIVGIHKKPSFNFSNFAGAFVLLVLVFMVNAVIITSKEQKSPFPFIDDFSQPFTFFNSDRQLKSPEEKVDRPPFHSQENIATIEVPGDYEIVDYVVTPSDEAAPVDESFVYVTADEAELNLTPEEKTQVSTTIANTKKVLKTLQWQEVEKSIADVMTEQEKLGVKQEYLHEIENINWKALEKSLKIEYDNVDWNKMNENLSSALTVIKLDSAQKVYKKAISQINKAHSKTTCNNSTQLPIPDVSICDVKKAKEKLKQQIVEIDSIRNKKVVKL